jgi:PAS domain S-box-containing protein
MNDQSTRIRQHAEKKLAAQSSMAPSTGSEDTERILHELRVHQIELEMQNEELRQAHLELAESRARYFDLYDRAPVGYCTLSGKGLIRESNLVLASLLGANRSSLTLQPLSRFISRDHQDAFYLWRKRLLETQGVLTSLPPPCELQMMRSDGSHFWAGLIASLDQDPDDAETLRVALADISERKQAESEQAKLEGQLLQAQKMEAVGRLAGGVAHDFNNMLMATMGYVDLSRDGLPAEHPIRSYLDEIAKITQRSVDLTRQLLAFARKQIIVPKVLDLNDVVSNMLKLLHRLIGENIHMAWRPDPDLWPVKLDPVQIDQILANLCLNARDAESNEISIRTANRRLDQDYCNRHEGVIPGDYVMLSVSDNGCGMDHDVLSSIFEPFFTTKEINKGTGLGLATVYGIIRQNNGYINASSELGRGTTFTIHLPRVDREAIRRLPLASTDEEPHGLGETILLVEDEPSLLMTIGRGLETLGYLVLAAATPAEALDVAARHEDNIHLLLSDMTMPGMNGRQLAEKLWVNHKGLPCVFMSGHTVTVMDDAELGSKNWCFLQKPFPRAQLARKLREMLDAKQDCRH